MNAVDQKLIDASLEHVRVLHKNISSMWDGDALATFYYSVIAGAIARNGPEVAQALTATLTEVYANTAKSHVDLGKLTSGFPPSAADPTAAR